MMAPKNGVNELSNLFCFWPLSTTLRLVNWAWWYELNHFLRRLVEHMDSRMENRGKMFWDDHMWVYWTKIRIGYVNSHSWFMFFKHIFWCQVWKHPTTSNNHNNSNGNFGTATAFFSRSARAHLHHLPPCHPTLRHGTTACPSGEL